MRSTSNTARYEIHIRSHNALQTDHLLHLPPSSSSIPLFRRLGTRTPRHTPLIPAPLPQPLLRAQLELAVQLGARFLPVDEIAEAAPDAAFPAVEPAARLSEIGHGRELAVDGPRRVPAAVECVAGFLRRVLVLEARVDVAD